MCKWTLRGEKFRDRERNSCKGPRFLFEIQRSSKVVDIERIHRNLSFGSVDRIRSHTLVHLFKDFLWEAIKFSNLMKEI